MKKRSIVLLLVFVILISSIGYSKREDKLETTTLNMGGGGSSSSVGTVPAQTEKSTTSQQSSDVQQGDNTLETTNVKLNGDGSSGGISIVPAQTSSSQQQGGDTIEQQDISEFSEDILEQSNMVLVTDSNQESCTASFFWHNKETPTSKFTGNYPFSYGGKVYADSGNTVTAYVTCLKYIPGSLDSDAVIPSGSQIQFEIYENDAFFDDEIGGGTAILTGTIAFFEVNVNFLGDGFGDSENEFYFKVKFANTDIGSSGTGVDDLLYVKEPGQDLGDIEQEGEFQGVEEPTIKPVILDGEISGTVKTAGDETIPCRSDASCGTSKKCVKGKCIYDTCLGDGDCGDTGTYRCERSGDESSRGICRPCTRNSCGYCTSDNDCALNEVCNLETSMCQERPVVACNSDSQCGGGKCLYEFCVSSSCDSSADCGVGYACVESECIVDNCSYVTCEMGESCDVNSGECEEAFSCESNSDCSLGVCNIVNGFNSCFVISDVTQVGCDNNDDCERGICDIVSGNCLDSDSGLCSGVNCLGGVCNLEDGQCYTSIVDGFVKCLGSTQNGFIGQDCNSDGIPDEITQFIPIGISVCGDGFCDQDEISICVSDCTSVGDDTDNDLDNDGVTNNLDSDIDGDGVTNDEDVDDDNDGIPDDSDFDDDGDGTLDTEEVDTDNDLDNDGINNDLDLDDDGDQVNDANDVDDDNDQVVDNSDTDDDGDGTLDTEEVDTNDDLDDDGLTNDVDEDDDGDGTLDTEEALGGGGSGDSGGSGGCLICPEGFECSEGAQDTNGPIKCCQTSCSVSYYSQSGNIPVLVDYYCNDINSDGVVERFYRVCKNDDPNDVSCEDDTLVANPLILAEFGYESYTGEEGYCTSNIDPVTQPISFYGFINLLFSVLLISIFYIFRRRLK